MSEVLLEMSGICKAFSGIKVLKGIGFTLKPGQAMALVGENGAGKSTLMRILSGIYQPDAGQIIYGGKAVQFKTAKESAAVGIQIIHQEFNLFPNLSVAENIFLDKPITLKKFGVVNWGAAMQKAKELVASIGGGFDVAQKVSELSVQNQQIVEIVKALAGNAKVLIMDEPTSALPENEVQNLFRTIRLLKERGVAIIYVSHRLNEIFEICEKITVLRDGVSVAEGQTKDISQAQVISHMVGRDVEKLYPKIAGEIGGAVFKVNGLCGGVLANASFALNKGEILGLYGLVGSGATECPEMLFGINQKSSGQLFVDGEEIKNLNVNSAINAGLAYVPADRRRQGIVGQVSVGVNISLAVLRRISGKLFVKKSQENTLVDEYIEKLRIKCAGKQQAVSFLSGGNQQKVVLAKWLATQPKVLILNDPTRGVDVGAKAEIYAIISQLAAKGMGVIITSSDIDEILGMADRILVFKRGAIVQDVLRKDATMPGLLAAAVSH